MKKLLLNVISILFFLSVQTVLALEINEDTRLINNLGHQILTSNHLPNADFVITDKPDTFDEYFVKANVYKTIEMYTWELSFAKDKGELTAVVAHQIGKISNNMATQARAETKTNTLQITDKLSYESTHIYSYEKLNKDKVDLAADRTAVDFLIQSENNPLALLSIYGRYLDYYEEDYAIKHIMNVYDYINYNFPKILKKGYPTLTYKKAMTVVNQQLDMRTEDEKQKVQQIQAKIVAKKLKQANSVLKGLNPWNSSYTTLLLHK